MQYADIEIANHVKKYGPLDKFVDADDVKSQAVIHSLSNVYMNYDPENEKGASITTYMRKIVHNSVITELKKASTQVRRNHPELNKRKVNPYDLPRYSHIVNGVMPRGKNYLKREAHGYMELSGVYGRKEEALNQTLMERWNRIVAPGDKVYVHGEFDSEEWKRLVNGDIQIVDDVPEGLPRGIRLI